MNITRRGFLQGAIGLAGAGMTGALTVPALKSLLPPPVTREIWFFNEKRLISDTINF